MKQLIQQLSIEIIVVCAAAAAGAVLAVRKLAAMYRAHASERSNANSTAHPAPPRCGAAMRVITQVVRADAVSGFWYVFVIAITWLAVAPVLRDPRLCILDCANVYRSYPSIRWSAPHTWLNVDNDRTSVRPGEILVHVPAFFTMSAGWQYWYLNGGILTAAMLALFYLVQRIAGSKLLALSTVGACLTTPSFVENFYTLGKCEPFMMAGAIGVLWILYMVLFREPAIRGFWWLLLVPVGVVSAVLATTVKETAVAFVGIYPVVLALFAWAAPAPVTHSLRRTAWLSLVIALGFAVMVLEYSAIPARYDQGGTAVYSLSPANLLRGVSYIAGHYLLTMPGWVLAMVMLVLTIWHDGRTLAARGSRTLIAWVLAFWVMWLGFSAIYVPWSSPQVRYFLPGAVALQAAVVLTISLAWLSASRSSQRWYTLAQRVLTLIILLLLAAHAVFTILVGHLSEGCARQQFDVAYDEMFKYIAAHTPRGGTAYFMYDREHEESRYNTRFGMPLFYGRPDINCVFPQSSKEFTTPGLVAVAHSAASYNPNRMPVHAGAAALFNQRIAAEKNFVEVTNITINAPLWFVDARAYRGFQYRTYCGLPAFWQLQRGAYTFGWTIYAYAPSPQRPNLIRNHDFTRGMQYWELWGRPCDAANTVVVVIAALRITNPSGEMRGVKQHLVAPLVSGQVYRLSATARLVGAPDVNRVLGGRVAVHLPPQPEYDVTWLTQRDHWWQQERIFTNSVNGNPIVLVHLGYGRVATTAEFTDIVLEQIEP